MDELNVSVTASEETQTQIPEPILEQSEQYSMRYEQHHPQNAENIEIKMINSYVPKNCPYCGSEDFMKKGLDRNGIQRYKCLCGKYFKPISGTIFESRKIPISEWIEYCLNIFRYASLNADSWNNRNAISISKYWLENRIHCLLKMFLNAHSGFNRDAIQAYLYSFVINPPYDHLEKVQKSLKWFLKIPNL